MRTLSLIITPGVVLGKIRTPWAYIRKSYKIVLYLPLIHVYINQKLPPSPTPTPPHTHIFEPLPFAPFKNCLSSRYVTVWHLSRSYLKKHSSTLYLSADNMVYDQLHFSSFFSGCVAEFHYLCQLPAIPALFFYRRYTFWLMLIYPLLNSSLTSHLKA